MPVTERDVDTVSKQQNEEKFGEIGDTDEIENTEEIRRDLAACERLPKRARNDLKTAKI